MLTLFLGVVGQNIKAGVLYHHKFALYWWAIRFMGDKFGSIYGTWHTQLDSHIQYLARIYELETGTREKNLLGAPELQIMYRQLFRLQAGLDNWKQHYAAWLLVYVCGVRPGSITVCPGYEAGAEMGVPGMFREQDETLRWNDVTFFRLDGVEGIAVSIHFKYVKGQRNPHTQALIPEKKVFTFIPTRGSRYELDVSAVFLALAFSRGLFPAEYRTLEDLHNGDEKFVKTVPKVAKQAVFVASEGITSDIRVETPMRESALNEKLRDMCIKIGLLSYFTIYALGRSCIIEVRRAAGTETAKQVAMHSEFSNTIVAYDTMGLADLDITALRMSEGGMSRDELMAAFSESKTNRYISDGQTGGHLPLSDMFAPNELEARLNERTKHAMVADERYIQVEKDHSRMLNSMAAQLGIDPLPNTMGSPERYRKMLRDKEYYATVAAFDEHVKHRYSLRDSLKRSHRSKELAKMKEEHREKLKVAQRSAEGQTASEDGRHTTAPGAVAARGADQIDEDDSVLRALDSLTLRDEDDGSPQNEFEELDTGALDEATQPMTRAEPEEWTGLADTVNVSELVDTEEVGQASLKSRLRFMQNLVQLTSIPTGKLQCMLCALDPSAELVDKSQIYTFWKLDRHLRSRYHARKTQIERTVKNSPGDIITCPLCKFKFKKKEYVLHVSAEHEEYATM